MWTRTPPTKPGRYRCRFLPISGVDPTPFEVELILDENTKALVVEDWYGIAKPLQAYENCEWREVSVRGTIEEAFTMGDQVMLLTEDNVVYDRVYIVERLPNVVRVADAPAAKPHAAIDIDDIKKLRVLSGTPPRWAGPPPEEKFGPE